MPSRPEKRACDACLRRTRLLELLAPHVERARHVRRLGQLLALAEDELLAAVAGSRRASLEAALEHVDVEVMRSTAARLGLQVVCRHDDAYPARLLEAPDAPAVLHVAGDGEALPRGVAPAVAVVGARRATPYGLEVARVLGRGLAAAGVPVVSGMALGIDSAAHAGALEAGGPTIAVLAGGVDAPYPRSKAQLYRRILATAGCCVVSEMPPGHVPFKWGFPARNRIIAGLADITIVVEAAERSGSLITAEMAQDLGRVVAAVPGAVTNPMASGTNGLLRDGADLVRGAQDVLDALLGAGTATVAAGPDPAALAPPLRALLDRLGPRPATSAALLSLGDAADAVMAGLAELELLGYARRVPGGAYVRMAG
ncbi:MAG: processing protein [Solirubrobacteraceae bacterium]|nr:processing protein [Solirubrobacteraceae bacterium]